MDSRILKKPPIESAVLEIRFNPNKAITLKKLEELSDSVSNRSEAVEKIVSGKFKFDVTAQGEGTVQDFENTTVGYCVTKNTGTIGYNFELDKVIVQFKEKYYAPWPALWNEMKEVLPKYLSFAPQTEVTRVGMRYVNELTLDIGDGNSISDFITSPISLPKGENIPTSVSHFNSEVVVNYSQDSGARIIQRSNGLKQIASQSKMGLAYSLDIDVWESITTKPDDFRSLSLCTEKLRVKRNDIFFAAVTEEALRPYE